MGRGCSSRRLGSGFENGGFSCLASRPSLDWWHRFERGLTQRLWETLAGLLDSDQEARLDQILEVADGARDDQLPARARELRRSFVSYTERYLDSTGIFRDALIGLLAALANQEGIRLSDRVKAGMARARIEGKHVGRPRLDDRTRRQVRELRAQNPDRSIRAIARETEVPYANHPATAP